ncbi:hypothetical protein U9M48_016803 [Paspalum notatum var. saurae]|uniref:DDE Tnp4 domain-containing protein n=1 Tax=Paspalum notatum var. saurae TaxID=547442 RepID=A0AAQ3T6C5_PASNO
MEPRIFKALADYLSSRDLLRSTRGVTVEEQLAMFMYMLARNASYRALCDRFQHSGETIHRHIAACFNAISSLAFDFVNPPSTETHWKISSNPHFAPYFQNCLGAIDGTHIPITISESSASDAGVLSSAIRSGFRVPTGKYYLVDGGYANTPCLMAQAQRARWTTKYEKGLVDILSKLQDKEAQLKKEYKAIKSIRNRSGVSWNQEASMINTSTEVWDEIIQEDSKLRRYEKKSFPLFDSLDLLYEGQIAEGKHLFTSSKPHSTSKGPEARGIDKTIVDFRKKNPWTGPINIVARPSASNGEGLDSPLRLGDSLAHGWDNESTETNNEVEKQSSCQRVDNENAKTKKRSSHELLENLGRRPSSYGKSVDLSDNDEAEEEHDTSSRSGTIGSSRGRSKRRNDTKTVPRIEETMSEFMSFKRKQAAEKEQIRCQGQEFSITKCLNVLKDMADLPDDVKIQASEVFKDATNREMFLDMNQDFVVYG